MDRIDVRPANEVPCADLATVFGDRGGAHECQCQRYRLARGESFRGMPLEERIDRLQDQTACGDPLSPRTSGLVAFAAGQPAGWCAVAPRTAFEGLVRNANQTAWRGRNEDRADPTVWAITCLFTRVGHRRSGVSRALAVAAVEFARTRGAGSVEAYPITSTEATWGENHPGYPSVYAAAGMTVVHEASLRRQVMRIEF